MITPTPHNEAKKGDIAKTVLMPGDPLRAKYIAENFLENPVLYNKVRGMFGYTGNYKGIRVSVQGSGMGVPSMGIYSKELFEGYDVDNIIRIGSIGALSNSESPNNINIKDIVVASSVETDSNYAKSNGLSTCDFFNNASENLLNIAKNIANKNIKFGKVFTSDVFYSSKEHLIELSKTGILGVEMETLALYVNANISKKNALAIFTVSDNPILGIGISASERENGFNKMIEYALDIVLNIEREKQ